MRDSVFVFAEAMEKKLQRDDEIKGGWENMKMSVLLERLHEEYYELSDAVWNQRGVVENVMQECCDVANFAMMIYSKLHPETSGLVRGRPI